MHLYSASGAQPLAARLAEVLALTPPDPFTPDGWRLAYAPKPSAYEDSTNQVNKRFDLRYSLGIVGASDGAVADTIDGSPARRMGIAPGDKILAVDGRAIGESQSLQTTIDAALVRAQNGGPPIRLLVLGGGVYRDLAIPYDRGPQYPVLERIPGTPDRLDAVGAPLAR